MPSLPSLESTISCFDDLDFFKDFENEFSAIVYNDAQTSKSDLLTELILSPQHIDEFDLNDKTSLSKYDEEEQNVLYFNDLFPFNIIHPDALKSEKDNDDNEVDIIRFSGGPDTAYLLLYVDDIILTTSSTLLMQRIISSLYAEFAMTYLGLLNYFLGISATRTTSGIFLSQTKYATEILKWSQMLNCNPCRTLVDTKNKLRPEGSPVTDPTLYRGLTGAL
ncbi:ribonuclease H-like domain-containing protein [Tanacetum coccineum]